MDASILLWLQDIRNGLGEGFAKVVTTVSDIMTSPVLYVILAGIFWCINKKKGLFYVFSIVGANFLMNVLKVCFCVFRPWLRIEKLVPFEFSKVEATGYSFPSGHSTGAASLFGAIGWDCRKKKKILIASILGILVIGLTRVYLGVHTPQDVLVGWLCGILFVAAAQKMLNWVERGKNRDLIVLIVGCVSLIAGLILTVLRVYPLEINGVNVIDDPVQLTNDAYSGIGMGLGLVIGWFVERRWIRFDESGTVKQKLIRYGLGALGMLFVYVLPKKLVYGIFGDHWGRFVLYFVTLIYVMILYPLVINLLNKKARQNVKN